MQGLSDPKPDMCALNPWLQSEFSSRAPIAGRVSGVKGPRVQLRV